MGPNDWTPTDIGGQLGTGDRVVPGLGWEHGSTEQDSGLDQRGLTPGHQVGHPPSQGQRLLNMLQ